MSAAPLFHLAATWGGLCGPHYHIIFLLSHYYTTTFFAHARAVMVFLLQIEYRMLGSTPHLHLIAAVHQYSTLSSRHTYSTDT